MNFGVFWVAFSLVFFYFFSMVINIAPNRKILNYGYLAQCKDFVRNLIPAFIMGACVYPISLIKMPAIVTLLLQIAAGVGVYWLVSVVTKNESYKTALSFAKSYLSKLKKK